MHHPHLTRITHHLQELQNDVFREITLTDGTQIVHTGHSLGDSCVHSLYSSGVHVLDSGGGGEDSLRGGSGGFGHRFAAAWARLRAAFGDG